MEITNLPPVLIRFLRLNNCYEEYLDNLKEHSLGSFTKKIFDNNNLSAFIHSAFKWEDTPQHHNFWSNINHIWRDYSKNLPNYQKTNNLTDKL